MNTMLLGFACVLLSLTATLAAPIGENQPPQGRERRPKTKEDVKNYLNQFGHWRSRSRGQSSGTDEDMRNSLRAYQKFFGLKVTGEADNETLELMATPRCGHSDNNNADGRRKRYVLWGKKWSTTALTYYFQNYTTDLPVDVTRSELQYSFKYWSDVTPLTFTESKSTSSAKINLLFTRLDHGDGVPFDGPGKVLAHAFYPTNGMTHFDADETWTTSSYGANLRQVGTHELGHVLGLKHSTNNSAVMYPYFTYKENFALDPDDIQGIQALYGEPRAPSTSTFSTSRSSTSKPTSSTSRSSTSKPSTPRQPPRRRWCIFPIFRILWC